MRIDKTEDGVLQGLQAIVLHTWKPPSPRMSTVCSDSVPATVEVFGQHVVRLTRGFFSGIFYWESCISWESACKSPPIWFS